MSDPACALSVVIVSTDGSAAVARLIASLGETRPGDVEYIVVSAMSSVVSEAILWIQAEPSSGVPEMRRLGLDRARGRIVAFKEDSCTVSGRWADAIRLAFNDDRVLAATGPVIPLVGDDPIDWAVGFCEYTPFLPRAGSFVSRRLAGNNFAIRREMAARLDPSVIHEGEVASACGRAINHSSEAEVFHVRRYSTKEAIRDRLRFGFEYGRRRAGSMGLASRFGGLLVGPAILLVQVVRLVGQIAVRPQYAGPFLETLPITLALLTAWSVGEWLGWIRALLGSTDVRSSER